MNPLQLTMIGLFDEFWEIVNRDLPGSREKSLVKTKLDEARMWAVESVKDKESGDD